VILNGTEPHSSLTDAISVLCDWSEKRNFQLPIRRALLRLCNSHWPK